MVREGQMVYRGYILGPAVRDRLHLWSVEIRQYGSPVPVPDDPAIRFATGTCGTAAMLEAMQIVDEEILAEGDRQARLS